MEAGSRITMRSSIVGVVDVLRVKQPSLVVKAPLRWRSNGRGQSTEEGMRAIAADDLQWIMATRGCPAALLLG